MKLFLLFALLWALVTAAKKCESIPSVDFGDIKCDTESPTSDVSCTLSCEGDFKAPSDLGKFSCDAATGKFDTDKIECKLEEEELSDAQFFFLMGSAAFGFMGVIFMRCLNKRCDRLEAAEEAKKKGGNVGNVNGGLKAQDSKASLLPAKENKPKEEETEMKEIPATENDNRV
eukprot:TRINITY_DN50_c0_g1_i1.p1 TRINITY_DN50_c0_g1~~TRINITY_DN50_c0_g1_i1.p1  ORF type:complete len:173 (-),score=53.44 TRINITY_DN50_c0_g1_i1:197-715(-)